MTHYVCVFQARHEPLSNARRLVAMNARSAQPHQGRGLPRTTGKPPCALRLSKSRVFPRATAFRRGFTRPPLHLAGGQPRGDPGHRHTDDASQSQWSRLVFGPQPQTQSGEPPPDSPRYACSFLGEYRRTPEACLALAASSHFWTAAQGAFSLPDPAPAKAAQHQLETDPGTPAPNKSRFASSRVAKGSADTPPDLRSQHQTQPKTLRCL